MITLFLFLNIGPRSFRTLTLMLTLIGAEPITLSLFLDVVACLATEVTREEFLQGVPASHPRYMTRAALFDHMQGVELHAVIPAAHEANCP